MSREEVGATVANAVRSVYDSLVAVQSMAEQRDDEPETSQGAGA